MIDTDKSATSEGTIPGQSAVPTPTPASSKEDPIGTAKDPNAPTPQSERAAEEQDDGAIPSESY